MPPTVFVRKRTVDSTGWTDEDTALAMALEDYEAGLCPGGNHPLAETTLPEHRDAYRPGERTRCHYCTARALLDEVLEKEDGAAGVLVPLVLDPEVVALNKLPAPPLPPELAGSQET